MYQLMETDKIRKWIRTIAAFTLLITAAGIVVYILATNGIIDETFTKLEILDFYINTGMGLVISLGLWRLAPWGWKLTVIFIPLSCVISLFELLLHYEWGFGLATAVFIIIDAFILKYLYKPQVRQFFNILSTPLLRLQWLVKALFLLALFIAVLDIFGGLVASITLIVVLLGSLKAKKIMQNLKKRESLRSG